MLIEVNKPYPFDITTTDGAIAELMRPERNTLLVSLSGISENELTMMRHGKLSCGVLSNGGAIILIWKFEHSISSPIVFDTTFDARIIPDIDLVDLSKPETRLLINVHIVESTTKMLLALRSITMSPELSRVLMAATKEQIASSDNGDAQCREWRRSSVYELENKTDMYVMGEL